MSDAMAMISRARGQAGPVVLDGDQVRGRTETRRYQVDGAALAAYARATGDTRPERISGQTASAAYAFVPLTALLFDVVDEVAGGAGPVGVVHTHQDFRFHSPIVAGDELTVTARVADLRSGRVTVAVDRDHPVRYAAASGDHNPIHLDAAYARNAGFPGPIVHGMCTVALSAQALEAANPHFGTVARLAVEFTRPVFPGDQLTVRFDAAVPEDREGRDLFFEVVNRKQRTVMRGGLLQLAP